MKAPSTFRIEGSLCVLEIKMADGGKKLPSIHCSKCSLKYNGETRTPRQLPCNHTLCKRCIQDILDQSEGYLKCPLCGKQHEVPCTKDAEAYPVNEDKLMNIRLLQEDEKEKKPKRNQDQNDKDSQSRSKNENEGLKDADKEKGSEKSSGKNKLTAKSSRRNEGTTRSGEKNEKTAKGSGNNEGTARSTGNNDRKTRSSGKNEPTAKGSFENGGASGPTGNSNNDKQPKDGDGNNDKVKSKCEKVQTRACEIPIFYQYQTTIICLRDLCNILTLYL